MRAAVLRVLHVCYVYTKRMSTAAVCYYVQRVATTADTARRVAELKACGRM